MNDFKRARVGIRSEPPPEPPSHANRRTPKAPPRHSVTYDHRYLSFIDAGELSSFIWRHMGNFSALLAALEDLSAAVSKGLHQIEKMYEGSSLQDQFVTRFIVKEAVFQLSKLSATLETAQKKFQENGIPLIDGSDDEDDVVCPQNALPPKSLQPYKACPSRRLPVRVRKQVVTQTSLHLEESSQDLGAQIKRLEAIVEKLANQVRCLEAGLPGNSTKWPPPTTVPIAKYGESF